MAISHSIAAGMSGIRAAGDLVARMQVSRGMRIDGAKKYVAGRLGVTVEDLTDEMAMNEVRRDLDLGLVYSLPGYAKGIEAKFHIANLLDVNINCVQKTRSKIGAI
jgi:dimethylamine--corrinoid protein Co-methyltransferase